METSGTYKFGVMPGTGANREDLRGGRKKRTMPTEREASRARADSLGAMHMAVAANKARANLAGGQKARGMQRVVETVKDMNPFKKIADALEKK